MFIWRGYTLVWSLSVHCLSLQRVTLPYKTCAYCAQGTDALVTEGFQGCRETLMHQKQRHVEIHWGQFLRDGHECTGHLQNIMERSCLRYRFFYILIVIVVIYIYIYVI